MAYLHLDRSGGHPPPTASSYLSQEIPPLPRLSRAAAKSSLAACWFGALAKSVTLPDAHRRFLLSFEKGEPDWALPEVPHVDRLPAVRWRMANLARLDGRRRAELAARLEEALARQASGDPIAGTGGTEG